MLAVFRPPGAKSPLRQMMCGPRNHRSVDLANWSGNWRTLPQPLMSSRLLQAGANQLCQTTAAVGRGQRGAAVLLGGQIRRAGMPARRVGWACESMCRIWPSSTTSRECG